MVKSLAIVESDRLFPSRLTLIAGNEVNEFAEDCKVEFEIDTLDHP